MSYGYENEGFDVVAQAGANARATFMRRTYALLAGSLLALVAIEAFLLQTITRDQVFGFLGRSPFGMLGIFLGFMVVSWGAQAIAMQRVSQALQYLGLGIYIVMEAFLLLPMFFYAEARLGPEKMIGLTQSAGILSLCVFGGLSAAVITTGSDYSFLRPIITIGCFLSVGLIVCAMLFQLSLGAWFSFAMVALLSACILYQTSEVMHRFPSDMYVAAALMLFSSIVTLFYYIFRILMSFQSRD